MTKCWYFYRKTGLDISCKLSPKETICLKYQILLSEIVFQMSAEILNQHAKRLHLYDGDYVRFWSYICVIGGSTGCAYSSTALWQYTDLNTCMLRIWFDFLQNYKLLFNDTATLLTHFVSSPRESEKMDRSANGKRKEKLKRVRGKWMTVQSPKQKKY